MSEFAQKRAYHGLTQTKWQYHDDRPVDLSRISLGSMVQLVFVAMKGVNAHLHYSEHSILHSLA